MLCSACPRGLGQNICKVPLPASRVLALAQAHALGELQHRLNSFTEPLPNVRLLRPDGIEHPVHQCGIDRGDGEAADDRKGVPSQRRKPLPPRAVALPLRGLHLDVLRRHLLKRAPLKSGKARPDNGGPATFQRVNALILQLPPQLERPLAPAPEKRTRRSQGPSIARAFVLVAKHPSLRAADHLQVEPAPVTVASRLGVPDLRRCQLPHRFILASIPGFVRASSGLLSDGDGTAEGLNLHPPLVIPDIYGTPRNDAGSRTGRSDQTGVAPNTRGTPESALGLPSPVDASTGRRRRPRPTSRRS